MAQNPSWTDAYHDLISAVTSLGHPAEFGYLIAKNLGSEKMMRRMTQYLKTTKPRSAEEIADEMLAIMSDRDRWVQKKEMEFYNAKLNRLKYEWDEEDNEEEDED
ncbi:MAG: hypothetical protein IJM50_07090 [Lachnospiraceae bacterium]|nr:hypothetical protein [Lachnospiraceae bacterium]